MNNPHFISDNDPRKKRYDNNNRLRDRSTSQRSRSRSNSPQRGWREVEDNLRYQQPISYKYTMDTPRFGEKRNIDAISMTQNSRFVPSNSMPFHDANIVKREITDTDVAGSSINNDIDDTSQTNTLSYCVDKVPNVGLFSSDHQESNSGTSLIYDPNKKIKVEFDPNMQIKEEFEDYEEYNEEQENQPEQKYKQNLVTSEPTPNMFITTEGQQSFISVASTSRDPRLSLRLVNMNQPVKLTKSDPRIFEHLQQPHRQQSQQQHDQHQQSQQQSVNTENRQVRSRQNTEKLINRSEILAKLLEKPLSLHGRFFSNKNADISENSNNILIESNCYRSPIKKNIAIRLSYTALTAQTENVKNQMFFNRLKKLKAIMQLPDKKSTVKKKVINNSVPEVVVNTRDKNQTPNIPKTNTIVDVKSLCSKCKCEVEKKVFIDSSSQTEFISNASGLRTIIPKPSTSSNSNTAEKDVPTKKNVLKLEDYLIRRAMNQQSPQMPRRMSARGACSSGYSWNRF